MTTASGNQVLRYPSDKTFEYCEMIIVLKYTWHRPTKIRPMAWKSKVSSQLKTSTKRPSWLPRAFTDSVLPVPAGPEN